MDVTAARVMGRDFVFCTDTDRDVVQNTLRSGRFYEQDELDQWRKWFAPGGTLVDIGSNVGNHAMYAAAFLDPERLICIEPNPRAVRLLEANIALNGMRGIVDLSHLGLGLSDARREDFGMEQRGRRLGSLRMLEGEGDLVVVPGDSLLKDTSVDFMKIDVEGMEMQVLGGLAETVSRCRPVIYIEVDRGNRPAFDDWLGDSGYVVGATYAQNRKSDNLLIHPADRG